MDERDQSVQESIVALSATKSLKRFRYRLSDVRLGI
jgi:hypothetical protein